MTNIFNSGKTNQGSCEARSAALGISLFSTVQHVILFLMTSLFLVNILTCDQRNRRHLPFVSVLSWYPLSALPKTPTTVQETGTERSNPAQSKHVGRFACRNQGRALSRSALSEVGHRYGAGDVCWRSTWPPLRQAGPSSAAGRCHQHPALSPPSPGEETYGNGMKNPFFPSFLPGKASI